MELKPVKQIRITSKFGPRIDPKTGKKAFHSGVDFGTPMNTQCYAVADGEVVASKVNGGGVSTGYGYYTVVQHAGFYVVYGHLAGFGLPVGTKVKKGDKLCLTGNSGRSTGPHLHFEVRLGGFNSKSFTKDANGMMLNAVDPEKFKMEIPKAEPGTPTPVKPAHERILELAKTDVELWKKYVANQSKDATGKYLPDLIIKVFNAGKMEGK